MKQPSQVGEAKSQSAVTVKLPRRYSPAGYGLTSLKVSSGADLIWFLSEVMG